MSEDVYYFSNGTEGSIWSAEWCDRCRFDHATHDPKNPDYENGCRHIVSMLCHVADEVFVRMPTVMPSGRELDVLHCMAFVRCPCDNGPDDPGVPIPPPIDPNQGVLFEAQNLTPGVYRDVVLDAFPVEVDA